MTFSPALYPVGQQIMSNTLVAAFANGYQQRWLNRRPLNVFNLGFKQLHKNDRDQFEAFVAVMQTIRVNTGDPTPTFTLPLDFGTHTFGGFFPTDFTYSYPGFVFLEDSISWTENEQFPGYYDGTIKCKQILTGGLINGAVGPFPGFGTPPIGYQTGYPFARAVNYVVEKVDMDTGGRLAAPLYAIGLPFYPTRGLFSWNLTLSTLSMFDMTALVVHFLGAGGMYRTFQFTDPTDNKIYNKVGYVSDTLEVQFVSFGICSVTLGLQEVYGPDWLDGRPRHD